MENNIILDSSGSMFYALGGTTVNFTVKLSTSGSVQMGYINNSGIKPEPIVGSAALIVPRLRFRLRGITDSM